MTTYHTTTTLNEIRAEGPCKEGWEKLLNHLGKTKADDEPIELLTILDSNGLDDALWCLRVPSLERLSRHFQAWCAEEVLHIYEREYPADMRVRDQIAMLRNDAASIDDRVAACTDARDAVAAAWRAAWSVAGVAARSARAAWYSAQAAAGDAADAAAWNACDAAWSAAEVAQEAQFRKMLAGDA